MKIKVEKFVTNLFLIFIIIFVITRKAMTKTMGQEISKMFQSNDDIYA